MDCLPHSGALRRGYPSLTAVAAVVAQSTLAAVVVEAVGPAVSGAVADVAADLAMAAVAMAAHLAMVVHCAYESFATNATIASRISD